MVKIFLMINLTFLPRQHIVPGYSDPLIYVTNLELQTKTSANGIVHGVLEVMGNSPGTAYVCLDSVDKSWCP